MEMSEATRDKEDQAPRQPTDKIEELNPWFSFDPLPADNPRMMDTWRPKRDFPFGVLRSSGVFLLMMGVFLLGLGLGDIVYTARTYLTSFGCDNTERKAALGTTTDPCDNLDLLIYTWVAAPVWSSIMLILTGAVGATLSKKSANLRRHRNAFGALCFVSGLVFCVLTMVFSVLDITTGIDVFVMKGSGASLDVKDNVKFVLPLLCALVACVSIIACFIVIIHVMLCANVYRELDYKGKKYTYREKKPRRMRRRRRRQKRTPAGVPVFHDRVHRKIPIPPRSYHAAASAPNLAYTNFRPGVLPYTHFYNRSDVGYRPYQFKNYHSSLPTRPGMPKQQPLQHSRKVLSPSMHPTALQQRLNPASVPANGQIRNGGHLVGGGLYPTLPLSSISAPPNMLNNRMVQGPASTQAYYAKKPGTLTELEENIDQMFDFGEEHGDSDSGWDADSNTHMTIDF